MEFVAHRAGNEIDALVAAEPRVDVIEIDVHLGEGNRVEVRHAKKLGFSKRLWERWYLLPRNVDIPLLSEIVASARPDTHLWLDLKGFTPRLSTRVRATMGERRPLTISTKPWWLLRSFAGVPGVRIVRSVGNRFELGLLLWLPSRLALDGCVLHYRLLTDEVYRRLAARGSVFCWGVVDASEVDRLLDLGATGVILDDVSLAR